MQIFKTLFTGGELCFVNLELEEYLVFYQYLKETFEDSKEVIRSHKSKDKQYNGDMGTSSPLAEISAQ